MYHALPQCSPDTSFGVFNNNVRVAAVALTQRYLNLKIGNELTKPIKPMKGAFETEALNRFSREVVSFARPRSRVYSYQEVVEMYTGAKRRTYEQAYQDYQRHGVSKHHANLSTFIKFEKTNVDKAPRVINPRNPVYNLCVARYLKKLEKTVYAAIHRSFGSESSYTVYKGMNIIEQANDLRIKWNRFVNPVAVGGDITKLDMHVSIDALKFEHSIYNRIFRSRRLKRLLSWQLINRGYANFADGSIKFRMEGTRSSGDINTSLGNVIIVCAAIYELYGHCPFELVNNGDDFVIITDRVYLKYITTHLPRIFHTKGFRLTMEEPVTVFEQIEFCQTNPVFDGHTWRMCRNPFTVFRKDSICLIPLQRPNVFSMWLKAVGDAGLSLCAGIPVLSAFYRMYQRSGRQYTESFRQQVFKNTSIFERLHNLCDLNDDVTEDARLSFYLAFSIPPDHQRDIEAYFDSVDIFFSDTEVAGLIRDNNLPYYFNNLIDAIPWEFLRA